MRGAVGILEQPVDYSTAADVVAAPDLDHEFLVRKRHEQWLGALSLEQTVEVEQAPEPSEKITLVDLIEKAKGGDPEALSAVQANAHTTVIETLLKTGNIMRIAAQVDAHGNLQQHNHTYDAIHRNSWLAVRDHSEHARLCAETEALNWQRTEAAIETGALEDNWFVIFSTPSDTQSIATLKKRGYFVHTMSSVFQATTVENGAVKTESAFVAGMDEVAENPDISNEENNARIAAGARDRYDLTAIRRIYMDFGVAGAELMSTEDLLATPLLIPKALMPHGVASIVELYDAYVGGDVFFGVNQPKQAYETYADVCEQRAEKYRDITDKVVHDLLKTSTLTPAQAISKMYKLVQRHTLERAYRDDSIDAGVFGAKAEKIIYQARAAYDNGDQLQFMLLAAVGHEVAVTTACGGGAGGEENASTDKSLDKSEKASELTGVELNEQSTWSWKQGICRVESCPTRPGKTKVGPCDVCRRCQTIFDKGADPTKFKSSKAKQRQKVGDAAINGAPKPAEESPTVEVMEKKVEEAELTLAA